MERGFFIGVTMPKYGEVGAAMASRQLVKQAQHGRLVTMWVNIGESTSLTGYVVGLDDYNVLVAMIQDNQTSLPEPVLVIVSKAQLSITRLHPEDSYTDLKESYREFLDPIRDSFLAGLAA